MKQRDPLLHMHFIYAEVQPVAAIKIFFCKSSRKHSEIAAKNSKRLQSLSHGIRCRGDMEGHCTTGRNRQCGIPIETHMHAAGTVGGSVDIAILPCRQSRVVRHSTCAHGIVDGDEGTSPSTEGDHVVAVILPIGERRVACDIMSADHTVHVRPAFGAAPAGVFGAVNIGHAGCSGAWSSRVGVMEFVSGEHVGGAIRVGQHERVR